MNGLATNQREIVSTVLRSLLLFGLAAAGATLGAQQRIATASVTVNVLPGLTATLTVDPPTIASGGSSTLRWTTTGASSATLTQDVGDDIGAVTPVEGGSVRVSPTENTTYTLTASDGDDATDDVTATVTVTVTVNPPVVVTFTPSSTSVTVGTDVTLSWTTTNAEGVYLQKGTASPFGTSFRDTGDALPADGDTTVTRSTAGSEEYRIRAYRGSTNAYSSSRSITWTALPLCVIDSFTANPSTIDKGASSELSWSISNATSASISPAPGTLTGTRLASGSERVTPPTTPTTTYTLTCSGPGGDDTASVRVTVLQPRATISADSTTITTGDETTLRWETEHVSSASISQDVGTDIGPVTTNTSGSRRVSPTEDTTYELMATNSAGTEVTDFVTITVSPLPLCVIDSFTATPSTIDKGAQSELRWRTRLADSTSIDNRVGAVTPAASGSEPVSPPTTTLYELTASGDSCTTNTATTRVTVLQPRATISADSTTITTGDETTLRWETEHVSSASISQDVGTDIGPVTTNTSGSRRVSPTEDTTYELMATNSAGTEVTDFVTITVSPLPLCVIDSFTATPSTIDKGAQSELRWRTRLADSTSIDNRVGAVTPAASGSEPVSPPTTTLYELTASGDSCTTNTATTRVTVLQPRATISADSTTITTGDETTLRWETEHVSSASIRPDPGVGTLTGTRLASGSEPVTPTTTTTYELTATNSAGVSVSPKPSVTINVNPPLAPTASLYADPEEIFLAGIDPSTLTWSTTNATSAEIDEGVGSVTPVADGSTTVYPDTTTTYTLTATGPGGSASDTATVYTIDSQRAITATLTAAPLSITAGESTTLSWTTEGADRASIDPGVGAVTPVEGGSVRVLPTATTTYTLTATKGEGDDAVTRQLLGGGHRHTAGSGDRLLRCRRRHTGDGGNGHAFVDDAQCRQRRSPKKLRRLLGVDRLGGTERLPLGFQG